MTPALSARLREATSSEHRDTETRAFITRLMGGELSLADYTRYLAQYAYVYEALEARANQPDDPDLIKDRALDRFAHIEADLEHLGASDWRTSHPALAPTAAYVAHLRAIEPTDAARYLAHHYTRYLGDLSGGQAIAALVARHYGATPEQLSFYRFEAIESVVTYKNAYREGLDQLGFTAEQEQALIEEAKAAFEFNGAIFDALGDGLPAPDALAV